MTRRDEPVPLRDAIAMVGKELGLPSPDLIATLTSRWVDIVGPAIALLAGYAAVVVLSSLALAPSLSRPMRTTWPRLERLAIVVDGPVWATQLRYGSSDLVARVNERCGEGAVTSVKVVVAGPRKTR